MRERKITEAEVERVLDDPDITLPTRRGRKDVMKRANGRLIRVAYRESSKERLVITAYAPEEESG